MLNIKIKISKGYKMKSTQKINYTTKFQSSKLYFDERYENMYGYLIREKAEGYLNDGADIDRDIITKVLESVDNIDDCCELLKLKYPKEIEELNVFISREYCDLEDNELLSLEELDYYIMMSVFEVAIFGGYNKLKDKFLLRRFFNMMNYSSEEEIFEFFTKEGVNSIYIKALALYGLHTNESEEKECCDDELLRICGKYEIDPWHDFMNI